MAGKVPILVAAIDFGTVYSGYAFSILNSSNKDLNAIRVNQVWNAGGHQLLSIKTPTALLLDDRKQLVAFGYHAENRYTEIVMDGKQNDYYYFYRFKMKLYENEGLSLDTQLEDIHGKSAPAINIFTLSIQYLKQHLLNNLIREGMDIKDETIKWVLTVPSIWSDKAKHFMRQAAVKAGISDSNLLVSLESEAASIYYHHMTSCSPMSKDAPSKKGARYLVVDIGGGTTDVTILQNVGDNKLREISRANGTDCGGTAIDNNFYRLLVYIVGVEVLNDMLRSYPTAYLDLFREFECMKRSLLPEHEGKITMSIPFLTLTQLCEKHHRKHFLSLLKASKYSNQMTIVHDKLRIEISLITQMFKPVTEKIVNLISNTLNGHENSKSINVILVGGFSESIIVQNAIKKSLANKVVVPNEGSIAVLKGAVIFGSKPEIILSRVLRFTYGFQLSNDYDNKQHDLSRVVEVGELRLCEKVFEKLKETKSAVSIGDCVKETFTTTKKFQDIHYLPLFTSTKSNPRYTDDESCQQVGTVVVRIPNPTERYRDVDVIVTFGHTELKIEAVDKESGNACETSFQYV